MELQSGLRGERSFVTTSGERSKLLLSAAIKTVEHGAHEQHHMAGQNAETIKTEE